MKRIAIFIALITLLSLTVLGCVNDSPQPNQGENLEKVTVVLDWVPNTNHTGLYTALAKGWYEEVGLDVEIIEPTQGGTAQLVATDKAHFGVSYQEDVTMARASGVPIVSIAAVIQHNTSGFASKADDNISSPNDLENRRYGGWGSPSEEAVIKAIMEKDQADFSKVQMVNIGSVDFFTALDRDIDFTWIYYGWDGVEAERRGFPLNVMMLRDLDPALDYYTPVLITSENLIAANPDLVEKFMKATTKGYEFTITNHEEAADILLQYAPELDRELVLASQQWLADMYQADAARWGEQKASVWENYAQWLYEQQLLPEMLDTDSAFTNQFLP